MKKLAVLAVLLCGLLVPAHRAVAEIGTIDDVPAATLLLPYFEVDLGDNRGITTLFSINNASASAAVAHVTFWTDESIPTLDFDIYLTGYDVQTINIRDIFNGILPRTADDGSDLGDTGSPNDGISNQGTLSQDINFPGSTGPCGGPGTLYNPYPTPTLTSAFLVHLRNAHTGLASPVFGNRCAGADYGDNIARGYITVDSVTSCNLSFPSDAGYATGLIDFRNILWGDYFYVNPNQNFAQGETLAHIEACAPGNGYIGYVGNGAGLCPFGPGEYTFYGRYAAVSGNDQREPLATTFATRFANGGAFDGGTDLIVWRDSKTVPVGANGPHSCAGTVGWFPLGQTDVVAFDEEENPTDLCFQGDNVSPATGGADVCFPLEAQRIFVGGGNVIADDLGVPEEFGWLYLNLNHSLGAGDPFPGVAQAWVTTVMDADGRFSVGYDAIQLDNATATTLNGRVLIP